MKKVMALFVGLILAICFSGCAQEGDEGDNIYYNTTNNNYDTVPEETCANPSDERIFDSYIGSGDYDMMTYDAYTSHLWLTPSQDLLVNKMVPQLWYCNGDCVYVFSIYDQDQNYKEFAYGSWQGQGTGEIFPDPSVTFPDVLLEAGVSYDFKITVLSNKSIGIYTTGSESPRTVLNGDIVVLYAVAGTYFQVNHIDRGAVAFKLLYETCPE